VRLACANAGCARCRRRRASSCASFLTSSALTQCQRLRSRLLPRADARRCCFLPHRSHDRCSRSNRAPEELPQRPPGLSWRARTLRRPVLAAVRLSCVGGARRTVSQSHRSTVIRCVAAAQSDRGVLREPAVTTDGDSR
jgi:hypothetical protein